jgi:hypothetical protein
MREQAGDFSNLVLSGDIAGMHRGVLRSAAKSAIERITSRLNSSYAGSYVFSGLASDTSISSEQTLTFESVRSDSADTSGLEQYTARDGIQLHFRRYPGASDEAPLAVVIHGSGWHGGAYTFIGRDPVTGSGL